MSTGSDPSGRKIARYEVRRELARGGMGVVYLAEQPSLGRPVVLKALQRHLDADPREAARFEREARAVAAVHHPNVVGVYDCFRFRGRPFIAQEYVDGADLGSVLARTGPFPARVAALVALEIARGLEEVHAAGLVHRDLKPANVLLGRGGEVKIADFGVALDARGPGLTRTGTALGTPSYMSPEQSQGARLDFRSDVFSFGVVVYEMCAGDLPFGEPASDHEPLAQRAEAGRFRSLRAAAQGVPWRFARTVHRCLRATPAQRARTTAALRRSLEAVAGAPSPTDARREIAAWLTAHKAFPDRARRTVRKRPATEPIRRFPVAPRWAAAVAIGVALLALSFGGVTAQRVGDSFAALAFASTERGPSVSARPGARAW